MKTITTILLSLLLTTLHAQCPDTLKLSGYVAGTYTADVILIEDTITSLWPLTLNTGCSCTDNLIPGIAVLGDSCIRDDEWISGGYADVLIDSASFHSPAAIQLFHKFGIFAMDDCGIKIFEVKEVQISPPGTGTDRPGETIKEFNILFYAEDYYGRSKEVNMYWRRVKNDFGCI